MAVNQPITTDKSPGDTAWELEVTQNINTLEQRLNALLQAIDEATDLDNLKERIRRIR